jgi:predicted enzyme related to lactoylglutathione lyase
LFGWQIVGSDEDEYAVARMEGRDVAGIGAPPEPDLAAAWITHVRVDGLDAAVRSAAAAGGTVLQAAIDADPAGRLAVIADPGGAVFCLWEAGIREGAQLVNEPGAWAMSALQTSDTDTAIAFYGAVFGWQPEAYGPVTLFRLPGYVGGEPAQPVARDVVAVLIADPTSPPRWSVDFWVADTDATAARAVELGGGVVMAPYDRPLFRSAVLADAAGVTFSISQLLQPPPEQRA